MAQEFSIIDAFRALEDVEDTIEIKPVRKTTRKVVNENVNKVTKETKLVEKPVYDMRPEYDSRKSFYGKARVDEKPNGTKILWSYSTPVCMIKDGKATLLTRGYYGWSSSPTTLRHVKEFLKQNGFDTYTLNELPKHYEVKDWYDIRENKRVDSVKSRLLKESETVNLNDEEDIKKGKEILADGEKKDDNVEQIVDVDAETIDELKDSYIGNVILRCPVCRTLIYKKPEALKKDEEDEEIYNKEDACPHCGAEDGYELVGQVASLNVEPEAEESTTGAPDAEEASEEDAKKPEPIEEPEDKEENKEVETEEEKQENNFAFEGLDEQRFDSLVNKYIHNVYENVQDYKTTDGELNEKENKFIVEGLITYKNGKTLKTKFVFEAVKDAKTNKNKFKGLNETFTKAKRPFTLVASIKDDNLVCEQLSYNYDVKVSNENKKVKGKVFSK